MRDLSPTRHLTRRPDGTTELHLDNAVMELIMLFKLADRFQPGPDYRTQLHNYIEHHWDRVILLDKTHFSEGTDAHN